MDKTKVPALNIMRSELSRVRGLGAAKTGVQHWWGERVSAIALLPLSLYFVASVLLLAGASREAMIAYMAEPWNAVLFLCLIAALFYHLALGMQVVIEDYWDNEGWRLAAIMTIKGGCVFLALACAVSVLKLAF